MLFPDYLKDGDIVGITACSAGVLKKKEMYERTIKHFQEQGLRIIETDNVLTDGIVSSDAKTRWEELKSLYLDDTIPLIQIAQGGDFLFEMLPFIEPDVIKTHLKWIVGSSDPTSLLYMITTKLDIATIYSPCNMCGMSEEVLHLAYQNYFSLIKGNMVLQERYPFFKGENGEEKNTWSYLNGPFTAKGILIGGCIDCLKDIIGTSYDGTKEFITKYKEDGIIWYFDVFSMSSEVLYNTLLQFQYAGYFEGTKAILISKVRFPSSFNAISYEDLIKKAFPSIKVIYQFDVGHVKPSFTMINGAKVEIVATEENASMRYL